MNNYLENLFSRFTELKYLEKELMSAFEMIKAAYEADGTVFVCGNGGSASDGEHIVGELMKSFVRKRTVDMDFRRKLSELYGNDGVFMADNLQCGLRAVSLTSHPALNTAFANDVNPVMVFAQQLYVMGRPGDVLIALSTSGNSANVIRAMQLARAKEIKIIAMTGESGGKCKEFTDCLINVPHHETFRIQEYHLPIYHTLCLMVEEYFYGC